MRDWPEPDQDTWIEILDGPEPDEPNLELEAHYNAELDGIVYSDDRLDQWMIYDRDDPQYRESLRHREYVVQQEQKHKRETREERQRKQLELEQSKRVYQEVVQRTNEWMQGLLDCGIEPDSDEYKWAYARAISRFTTELLPKKIHCPGGCEASVCANCRRCFNCEYGIYYEGEHDSGNADAPCSTCSLRDLLNAKYENAIRDVFLSYDLTIQWNPNDALAYYERGKAKYKLGQIWKWDGKQDMRIALILARETGNVQLKNEIEIYIIAKAQKHCSIVYENLKTCDTELKSKREYLNEAEQIWGQSYTKWDTVLWNEFSEALDQFAQSFYDPELEPELEPEFRELEEILPLPPTELGEEDSFISKRVDLIIWRKKIFRKESNTLIAVDAGISERTLNQWISEGEILQQQFLSGEIKYIRDLDFYSQEILRLYEALHPSTEGDF